MQEEKQSLEQEKQAAESDLEKKRTAVTQTQGELAAEVQNSTGLIQQVGEKLATAQGFIDDEIEPEEPEEDTEEIKEKKEGLRSLVEEVEVLQEQLEALTEGATVDESINEFVLMAISFAPLSGEIQEQNILEQLEEMIGSLTELKEELLARIARIRELQEEKERLENEIEEKENQLEELEERLGELTDELAEQEQRNQEAAQYVIGLIEAIPENATYEDKEDIEGARKEYNALTRSQKNLVGEHYNKLLQAEAALAEIPAPEVDKSQLEAKLGEARGLNEENYTTQSWATLQSAMAMAEYTMADDDATETSVTNALANLINALNGLETQEEPSQDDVDAFKENYATVLNLAVNTVTLEYKESVNAALAAYAELTAEAKAKLVEEKALLDSLLTKIEELEQVAQDQAAAEAVIDQIATLPLEDELTLIDKEAVEAARAAYEDLTSAQQALVTNLDKLATAETKIVDLVADKEAEEAAASFRTTHSTALELTIASVGLDNKGAVTEALAAYEEQSEAAQAKLAEEKALLDSLLTKIEKLEQAAQDQAAAQAVIEAIAELSSVENLTLENQAATEAARAAYDALTETQQALVTNLKLLTTAEAKIAELLAEQEAENAANSFKVTHAEVLAKAVDTVSLADNEAINAALAAYAELTEEVQAKLGDEKTLLDSLLTKIGELEQAAQDQAAAEAVINQIDELPTIDDLALKDKEAVEAARAAYEALTETQQDLVTNLNVLKAAKTKIAYLEENQAVQQEAVSFKTNHATVLGLTVDTVEIANKEAVNEALSAYGELSESAQAKLTGEKALLDNLLIKVGELEQGATDRAAAQEVINVIAELPATENLTLGHKAAVEAARTAYENLTEAQQVLVTSLTILEAAETKIAELLVEQEAEQVAIEAAETFKETVKTALTLDMETVQIADKEIVEGALDLYDQLQKPVQAKLEAEKALLDNLLEKIESLEQANQNAADGVIALINNLPSIEDLRLDNQEAVETARTAYNNLTTPQKELVSSDVLGKLEATEAQIEVLIADKKANDEADAFKNNHEDALKLTVDTVAVGDKEKVDAALKAYDELSQAAKDKLIDGEKTLLDSLKTKILELEQQAAENLVAANNVDAIIVALPSTDDLSLTDKEVLDAARAAYNALTQDQKSLVTKLSALEALEAKMDELEKTVDLVGDEIVDGHFVVNRSYTDNSVKSDNIGSVALWIGAREVTSDFDINFYDTKGGNKINSFDLSNGGTTFKVYMEAKPKDGKDYFDVEADVFFKYGSVTVGNNEIYYTIEDALGKAESGTIFVKYNTSFADSDVAQLAYGDAQPVVKKGVTLLLPYSEALSIKIDDTPGSTGKAITRNSAYVELTVPGETELRIMGTLTVNAMRASYGTKYAGHVTTTNYSQLCLDENSKITIESGGMLSAMGFVYGEGQIDALSGSTVNDSLFIQGFRGGTATLGIQSDVFPFDQFTINNIETDLVINYGAIYNAKALIFVSNSYRAGDLKLVGTDSKSLIQLKSGKLIKTYDAGSALVTMDFHADAQINVSSINVAGITANSSGKDMPFDGTWKFNSATGSNVDIDSWMVLLPGALMNIEEGAIVTITKNGRLGVFDPYEHLDDYNDYPAKSESYYRVAPTFNYKADSQGKLTIDGTLIVEGGLAGRVHVGDSGSLNLKDTAYTSYDYKYVLGSAGDAKSNSRELTPWEEDDSTLALVATPSTLVPKDETVTTLVATVKDKDNKPVSGVEVTFNGGQGAWSPASATTDTNGQAAAIYTTSESEETGTLVLTATANLSGTDVVAKANMDVKKSDSGGSCPFVYTYDGQVYHFEHEAIPFTVNKALETTSYATLRQLQAVDGQYRIKIAETLQDKSFVKGVQLSAVDYQADAGIKGMHVDIYGTPHTIQERIAPIAFTDSKGISYLPQVIAKDQLISLGRTVIEEGQHTQSYVATFDKPETMTKTAKFMVGMQTTELARSCWHWFLDATDGVNNTWWMERILGVSPLKEMFTDFVSIVNVQVELWNGSEWINQGKIMPGLYLLEEFLVPMDLSIIDANESEVKVRLTSGTGFYEIDQVSIDYSQDRIAATKVIEPVSALFNGGENVKPVVQDFDNDEYVRLVPGDEIDLVYHAPKLEAGYERGFTIAVKGYYHANPDSVENAIAGTWAGLMPEEIIAAVLEIQPEAAASIPMLEWMLGLMESVYGQDLETKMEQIVVPYILPWLYGKPAI